MLPAETAVELSRRGHDAVAATERGLSGQSDPVIFERAVSDGRIVITENVADFAVLLDQRLRSDTPATPVVFVRKRDLPGRGALAHHLAERLHGWAEANSDPYLGPHWL